MKKMTKKTKDDIEVVCQNRKARHDYHILESLEVGIVLVGHEVKSLREHHVALDSAYAYIVDGELWLVDCNIDPYKYAGIQQHDPKRKRKLLIHKKEIKNFAEKAAQKGNTLVPLRIYFNKGRAKVELAVCKGKQEHDKRQSIKDREAQREMRQ
jgi:SsrA-binding protein